MNWLEPQGAVGSNPQVLWEIESEVQDSVWRGSGVVRSMSRRDELRPGLTWEEIGLRGQPGAGAVLGSWLWCRLLAGFFLCGLRPWPGECEGSKCPPHCPHHIASMSSGSQLRMGSTCLPNLLGRAQWPFLRTLTFPPQYTQALGPWAALFLPALPTLGWPLQAWAPKT